MHIVFPKHRLTFDVLLLLVSLTELLIGEVIAAASSDELVVVSVFVDVFDVVVS